MEKLKKISALYVDDDLEALVSMQKTLAYFFRNVFIATNGQEALEIFEKQQIGVIFSDYDMPVMDGYTFLRHIRSQNKTIPAVIISSYSDKEKLFGAIKLNLVDYLVRPFDLAKLKTILQECASSLEDALMENISLNQTLFYNPNKKTLHLDKEEKEIVTLTKFESFLLEYLLKNESKIISFEEIISQLDFVNTNRKSIVNTIYKLNKKLSIPLIYNMKDVGYMLKRDTF